MTRFRRFILMLGLTAAAVLLVAACGGDDDDTGSADTGSLPNPTATATLAGAAPSPTATPASAFPVTIQHEGRSVTIKERPKRIVALSNDVADIALRLAGPERVAALPASNGTPSLAAGAAMAGSVATKLPPGTNPEPEQILSLKPDLVLITTRHGGEQDAAKLLEQVNVPLLIFAHWGKPEVIAENVRVIGKAVGEVEKAEQLVKEMEAGMERVKKAVAGVQTKPRVVAFSDQANRPFLIGKSGGGITPTLIAMAGGELVTDQGGPAQTERVVALNPDVIVIIDVWGKGLENYRSILDAPAMQALPAVKNNRIIVLPAWQAFLPTDQVWVGLEALAKALHPEAFRS
jgi:iron complex transport system substrate-binding protein